MQNKLLPRDGFYSNAPRVCAAMSALYMLFGSAHSSVLTKA